jgi:hypothetical protein
MFNDSNYVKGLQHKQTQAFEENERIRLFEKRYRTPIEQGMTRESFTRDCARNTDDLKLFDDLKAKIDEENKLGEAFLAGFTSKPPVYTATAPQGQQSNESEV